MSLWVIASLDPRSKSFLGINILNRPTGQWPETTLPPDANHFLQHGFGFIGELGGFAPMATERFGNFTLSAVFGGFFLSLSNLQVHGFPDATMYGPAIGFPYRCSNSFHGGYAHGFPQHPPTQGQQAYYHLKMLFLMIGIFMIIALIGHRLNFLAECKLLTDV